ncbi:unnamed protein product [Linum trigynum]|uniref:MORF/ORRM1/DAG-like MORF domain-containing protein n=1 Tax=Linum trigynum TaxID=586398 RepID=A0AAV2EH10_9ROSI
MAAASISKLRSILLRSVKSAAAFNSAVVSARSFSSSSVPRALFRPLAAAHFTNSSSRCYATETDSSLPGDPSPNWWNRLPIGFDSEHWLVVMEEPEGNPRRNTIINDYIKTLAQVVGSEEEARMKIYSVSTRQNFAFGALVSEELSYKLRELPRVRWVLPGSYLDLRNKDYGGETFTNVRQKRHRQEAEEEEEEEDWDLKSESKTGSTYKWGGLFLDWQWEVRVRPVSTN